MLGTQVSCYQREAASNNSLNVQQTSNSLDVKQPLKFKIILMIKSSIIFTNQLCSLCLLSSQFPFSLFKDKSFLSYHFHLLRGITCHTNCRMTFLRKVEIPSKHVKVRKKTLVFKNEKWKLSLQMLLLRMESTQQTLWKSLCDLTKGASCQVLALPSETVFASLHTWKVGAIWDL